MIERTNWDDRLRSRKTFEFRIVRLKTSRFVRPHGQSAQTVGSQIVRNSDANLGSNHSPGRHLHIAFSYILVDEIVREPCQTLVLLHSKDFRLIGLRGAEDRFCNLLEIHELYSRGAA